MPVRPGAFATTSQRPEEQFAALQAAALEAQRAADQAQEVYRAAQVAAAQAQQELQVAQLALARFLQDLEERARLDDLAIVDLTYFTEEGDDLA